MKGLVYVPPLPAYLEELKQSHHHIADCYPRHAAVWLGGAGVTTWAVSQAKSILNICEIHISQNFSFKFGGIILTFSTLNVFSFINHDHIVSVIFASKMISNVSKHPVYIYMHVRYTQKIFQYVQQNKYT